MSALLGLAPSEVRLTNKERECLKWLVQGKSFWEIGVILDISEHTVATHINHVKEKLNCYKQVQLGYFFGLHSELLCEFAS